MSYLATPLEAWLDAGYECPNCGGALRDYPEIIADSDHGGGVCQVNMQEGIWDCRDCEESFICTIYVNRKLRLIEPEEEK